MTSPEEHKDAYVRWENRDIRPDHVATALQQGESDDIDAATAGVGGTGPPSGVSSGRATLANEMVRTALTTGLRPDNALDPTLQ